MDFRSLQSLALRVGEALTLDHVFNRQEQEFRARQVEPDGPAGYAGDRRDESQFPGSGVDGPLPFPPRSKPMPASGRPRLGAAALTSRLDRDWLPITQQARNSLSESGMMMSLTDPTGVIRGASGDQEETDEPYDQP